MIDVVVIGGGPAGAAIGRLLASWGHSVRIVAKPCDRARGLGESLPPSTKKLLDAIGVLDAVEQAGFYKTTGNTVWWASRVRRVETFDPSGRMSGYQVFRPDFDRVLLESAVQAGADVTSGRVLSSDAGRVVFELESSDTRETLECRFVVDCSGRAGVLAKKYRRYEPTHRMYSLVGVWDGAFAADVSEASHTVVETYEDGWAWSVPISASTRHVGAMVDGTSPRVTSGRVLVDAYQLEIDKTTQIARLLDAAALQHVFACDASLYSSEVYGGPGFLLAGDAGSFIDPLSSFGVKKALASAWVGAVTVHTCLTHPEREAIAVGFFTQWERDVYATHLARSRDFARTAHAQHPHAFWATRAAPGGSSTPLVSSSNDELILRQTQDERRSDVQAAFARFRESDDVRLVMREDARFVTQPIIRGREIVMEEAVPDVGRFFDNVDLVALAGLAREHSRLPDLVDAYCRAHAPVPLPSVLGGLSLLVAKGILAQRV